MMRLLPSDQRRAALSAGLLASDNDGEVVAAARALCGLLRKCGLGAAEVVSAGLSALAERTVPPAVAAPRCQPSAFLRPLHERARMARLSPHINDWERAFLNDMIHCRGLSQRQESLLKAILRKSDGGAS